MVKMKDVANRAGVSVATVSNVITGKRIVSPAVRRAVLDAIEELDYHVNMVARGLKTQRTSTIGVILPDVTKLFFNDVLKGIMTAASDLGYGISIHSSNYDFEEEKRLIAALRGLHVDGIVLDSCVDYRQDRTWGREIVHMLPDSIPVVSLENVLDEHQISSVTIDCRYWSAMLTRHLMDQGRKKIFFISGPPSLGHEQERLQGYRQALLENGCEISEDLITHQDFLSGSAYDVVRRALSEGLEFDAVQASNDQAAIGAIKALKEAGIEVPGRVAVTGFDNIFPSSLVNPAITTIHVPRYEMGYQSVAECIRRIADQTLSPRNIQLECETVLRNSSADLPETTWDLDNW